MNILFSVFGFLTIFVFFGSTLLKRAASFSSEQKAVCSYIVAKEKLEDRIEAYKYRRYVQAHTPPRKKNTRTEPSSPKPFQFTGSHREKPVVSSKNKWNLYPMLATGRREPELEKRFLRLLELLYGHTEFWNEGKKLRPDLPEALVSAFVVKSSAEKLSDLFPSDPELRPIFYKILKGSGHYDQKKHIGYPPLEDFVSLERNGSKVLVSAYAALPVLQAFFGVEVTAAVLEAEEEKSREKGETSPLSKQEFFSLLDQLHFDIPSDRRESWIDGSYTKPKREKMIAREGTDAWVRASIF